MPKKRLGELLIQHGLLTQRQLEQALTVQREEGALLGEVLLRMGVVRQADLGRALAEQHGVSFVVLEDEEIDPQIAMLLPEDLCRSHMALPFRIEGATLQVAMVQPDDLWVISEIELLTGYGVEPSVAAPTAVRRAIDQCFDRNLMTRQTIVDMRIDELRKAGPNADAEALAIDAIDSADPPVVRLVNSILSGGISSGASDIHFEPQHPEMRVRYRIDGVLYENMVIPSHIEAPLVSRLKVMADLDITERRHPQDGHISFTADRKTYDMRVSTLPTVTGEKIVIRILEKDAERFHLDKLGFSPEQRVLVDGFLGHPYGMILVTGPTGSGKTTSLYGMLNHLNEPEINIITVEDPVENQMYGMNQVGVDPNFGMTFASALKYILRQDPDIVMVGEIRDGETAEIAIQAALTGHLMLSTLHTNDAPGAVTRLLELDVPPFLVSSSLVGVVAQRLLRRVCPHCRAPWTPDAGALEPFGHYADALARAELVKGNGCDRCFGTGYRGRIAVFELLRVSPGIASLIDQRASAREIEALAVQEGMKALMAAGVARAIAGETTLNEVRDRVLVWEQTEQREEPAARHQGPKAPAERTAAAITEAEGLR